jgi:hypothetical protein
MLVHAVPFLPVSALNSLLAGKIPENPVDFRPDLLSGRGGVVPQNHTLAAKFVGGKIFPRLPK